ncbi:MAG: hypothetical protein AB7V50_07625 [Vampirovibrionia bacterium]
MKYILNEKYANAKLVSQCGKIFTKDDFTEIADNESERSFEVNQYIKQRFIIPFSEEIIEAKEAFKKVVEKQPEIEGESKSFRKVEEFKD